MDNWKTGEKGRENPFPGRGGDEYNGGDGPGSLREATTSLRWWLARW